MAHTQGRLQPGWEETEVYANGPHQWQPKQNWAVVTGNPTNTCFTVPAPFLCFGNSFSSPSPLTSVCWVRCPTHTLTTTTEIIIFDPGQQPSKIGNIKYPKIILNLFSLWHVCCLMRKTPPPGCSGSVAESGCACADICVVISRS